MELKDILSPRIAADNPEALPRVEGARLNVLKVKDVPKARASPLIGHVLKASVADGEPRPPQGSSCPACCTATSRATGWARKAGMPPLPSMPMLKAWNTEPTSGPETPPLVPCSAAAWPDASCSGSSITSFAAGASWMGLTPGYEAKLRAAFVPRRRVAPLPRPGASPPLPPAPRPPGAACSRLSPRPPEAASRERQALALVGPLYLGNVMPPQRPYDGPCGNRRRCIGSGRGHRPPRGPSYGQCSSRRRRGYGSGSHITPRSPRAGLQATGRRHRQTWPHIILAFSSHLAVGRRRP